MKEKIVAPSAFSQNARLSDLVTSMNLRKEVLFGRNPLNCKFCGSTHTLRKIEDGYLCELHFKELKK